MSLTKVKGSVWESSDNNLFVNVKDAPFNAKGDGVTDDTAAIQAALTHIQSIGGTLFFPTGRYKVTTGLTMDVDTGSDIRDETKVALRGNGEGATVIDWKGSGGGIPLLKISSSILSGNVDFEMYSMKLVAYNRDVDGLQLQDMAWCSIRNVTVHGFNVGFKLRDVISSSFKDCNANACIRNIDADRDDSFNPNAISFYSCTIGTAKEFGVYINKPTNVTFYGGSFEGNGVDTVTYPTNRGAIQITNSGAAGGIGVNFHGVYFENNLGQSDIWIIADGNPTLFNVIGCNFNRVNNGYATNHIYIDHDSGDGELSVNIIGSSFRYFGTYTPDAGRPIWDFTGTGTIRYVNTLNNYYQSATECPNTARCLLASSVPNMKLEDNDGSYHEIMGNAGTLSIRADHGNAVASSTIVFAVDGSTAGTILSGGTLNMVTAYQINGTKVVGARGAAVSDASGGATVDVEARTAINTLLSRLRTHGLIGV